MVFCNPFSCCVTDNVKWQDPDHIQWYPSREKLKETYQLGETLGEGNFAKVVMATRVADGRRFATKIFKKRVTVSTGNEVFPAPAPTTLLREIRVLRLLGGRRNCLRLETALETPMDFYILMDVCAGGELMTHLEKAETFTEEDASRYFRHFCGAIAHCHDRSVAHRDVKPENLLVAFGKTGRAAVVLSDFGSATEFALKKDGSATRYDTETGSPFWSSPEAWNLDYDYRSDVYSCGLVLLVLTNGMLTGHHVRCLHGEGLDACLDLRRMTQPDLAEPSGELLDLLRGLLAPEDDRLKAAAALKSPWLTAARGDKNLANPAAAALALRALDRAAKTLVALLDDGPREKMRSTLDASSRPGLPARCVLLGDVIRALDDEDESPAAATLRVLHPDPDIVLVHKPFALEAAYVKSRTAAKMKAAAEKRRKSEPGLKPAEAPARMVERRSSAPATGMKPARSDSDLQSLNRSDVGRRLGRTDVGRRGAPGAGASFASMDGTFYSIDATEQMDTSKASVGMRLDGSLDGSGYVGGSPGLDDTLKRNGSNGSGW